MRKNFFSFSPKTSLIFTTVIILSLIGAAYFFWYIPNNQSELERKQFRCLQNIDNNAKEKIDNSLALLNTLILGYMRTADEEKRGKIIAYINSFPENEFKLSSYKQDVIKAAAQVTGGVKSAKPDTAKKSITNPLATGNKMDTVVSINENHIAIQLRSKLIVMEVKYTFKKFIKPLLQDDVFDNYIILKGDKVVFQTFASGIFDIKSDSLTINRAPKNIFLSGVDYKIFSQHTNLKAGEKVVITGLLAQSRYSYEKNKLPEEAVIFLIVFGIVAVLALPWIKLYQMGSQDRMTAADGVFSLAAPMLLMSILFFVFFFYYASWRPGSKAFKMSSDHLSGIIKKEFTNEIDSTYTKLQQMDTILSRKEVDKKNQLYDIPPAFDADIRKRLTILTKHIVVNQINVLDSNGRELRNWSPASSVTPLGDYSGRDYFKNLKDKKPFYIGGDTSKKYYLEPVISRTTNSFTTVMCIPHKSGGYTSMSFKLQSLDHPLLTEGYQYCIITQDGRVLYHSDPAKQLNENLLAEFSESEVLADNMLAHKTKSITTKYSGKEVDAFVSPIENLPFSMVILSDKAFTSITEFNSCIFSFSMLFFMFLILGLELVALFAFSARSAYYKKHYFDISWLGPNNRFGKAYSITFAGHIALIILLLLCWLASPGFWEFLFIFLIAATLSYLFQNALYAQRYREDGDARYKLKIRAIYTLVTILILINFWGFMVAPGWRMPVFEVISIIVLWLIWIASLTHQKISWPNWLTIDDLSKSYSLMTFSRLIITSGLPVAMFFITIANYDLQLTIRYRHTSFVSALAARGVVDNARLANVKIYNDGVWLNRYNIIGKLNHADSLITQFKSTGEESRTVSLISQLFADQDAMVPGLAALTDNTTDTLAHFSNILKSGAGVSFFRLPNNQYLRLQSIFLRYGMPWKKGQGEPIQNAVIFWAIFLSVLFCFWLTFHNVLKRLFGLNLPLDSGWNYIDELLLENNSLNNLVFLIGPPGSGKMGSVINLIQANVIKDQDGMALKHDQNCPKDINYFVADMTNIPNNPSTPGLPVNSTDWDTLRNEALKTKYKLVVVNQFEYDIKNADSNRTKLAFLEDLLQKGHCKLIIVSTVHPINFLDSLNRDTTPPVAGTTGSPEHDLERWHVLLGRFRIVIKKLVNKTPETGDGGWQATVRYETSTGRLLNDMQAPILSIADELNNAHIGSDSISLKLGITAHYYYMYVWQSLTKEEKFILYDLAEDGLVNPFDDYNIVLLISKGLLVKEDGILKLFNQGFRDFILTAIGRSEALDIQKQIKDNGNWGKLKTPILILILAVMVFLFASERESYSNLLKYLAVLTAGITTLLPIFTQFGSKDNK